VTRPQFADDAGVFQHQRETALHVAMVNVAKFEAAIVGKRHNNL
jgi:hypothetical protein